MSEPTTKELIQSLRSTTCPTCGGTKKSRKTLCYGCYKRLPGTTKAALYDLLGEGYEQAVAAAMKHLGAARFIMPLLAVALLLTACEPPTHTPSSRTVVGRGRGGLVLKTVEHDGHTWVALDGSYAGGLEHHPDCPCNRATGAAGAENSQQRER